jgi:ubiquinone biosynthesis protein
MKNRVGPKALIRTVKEQAPEWLYKLPHMPQLVFDALQQIKRLDTHQRAQQQLALQAQEVAARRRRRVRAGGVLLLVLAVVLGAGDLDPWLQHLSASGWLMAAGGFYLLLMH